MSEIVFEVGDRVKLTKRAIARRVRGYLCPYRVGTVVDPISPLGRLRIRWDYNLTRTSYRPSELEHAPAEGPYINA